MTPGDLVPSGEGMRMMTPTATDYRDHALRWCGPWPSHAGDTAPGWSSRSPLVAEELKPVSWDIR